MFLGEPSCFPEVSGDPTSGQLLPSVSVAEFVSVNSGSGQGLGVKAAHSGINVRWEPSHVPETHPLNSGR